MVEIKNKDQTYAVKHVPFLLSPVHGAFYELKKYIYMVLWDPILDTKENTQSKNKVLTSNFIIWKIETKKNNEKVVGGISI